MIQQQLQRTMGTTAKRRRGLAVLLLACLAWGVTAEFTHHHGSQAQIAARDSVTFSTEITPALQSDNSNRTNSNSRSRAECLICQLHQNLSASEINQPSLLGALESQLTFRPTNVAVHLAEFADTRRGRAPPTIL